MRVRGRVRKGEEGGGEREGEREDGGEREGGRKRKGDG